MFWMMGFSTCLSLLVEEKVSLQEGCTQGGADGRNDEQNWVGRWDRIVLIPAMYVLPRALESAWSTARKRAWVPIVPFGETILGAAAMGMVMDAYKVGTQCTSELTVAPTRCSVRCRAQIALPVGGTCLREHD